jgi:hypothetical protein
MNELITGWTGHVEYIGHVLAIFTKEMKAITTTKPDLRPVNQEFCSTYVYSAHAKSYKVKHLTSDCAHDRAGRISALSSSKNQPTVLAFQLRSRSCFEVRSIFLLTACCKIAGDWLQSSGMGIGGTPL